MKLFLISQTERDGYDTYDSAVVCAESENDARLMHPDGDMADFDTAVFSMRNRSWCGYASDVTVQYLGEADKSIQRGAVCASYRAG